MTKLAGLRSALAPIKRLVEPGLQVQARLAARWASFAHQLLLRWQWGIQPVPEHFDHHIDLFHSWQATRESYWLERGVFSSLCLDGGDVLDLCCGDGFHARNFYSLRSRRIVACDFDAKALATARTKNPAPNIDYVLTDIRTAMPEGRFGTVTWNAAIEHFTEVEIDGILRSVKKRLEPGGIVSGYTVIETGHGLMSPHHEYEFKNKDDLVRLFRGHFANVRVFETIYPQRHNLYLWAGDGPLPFDPSWARQVTVHSEINR